MRIKDVITEVSLGDYRRKASMQKAQSQMGAMFGSSPEARAKDLATYQKRERGLERLKARDELARKSEQAKQLADLVARLPELKAEYEKMRARYKALGGSNWQYADREQNMTDAEREARSMEGQMNNLWRQIQAAEKAQGQQGVEEDWQKVNRKDKTAGMSRKAVKAYRREHPGSKLKTAVTTKPSKLKKGSKSAKRRKSFCARMSGMKRAHASAKTKRNPDSPINKALRRWNCESIEDMRNLIEYAEQVIAQEKNLVHEGRMSEVDAIIHNILDGDMDAYDIMVSPKGAAEQYVSDLLQKEYENIAINHRLHADDDFEQILDIVLDNLAKDYRID